MVSFQIHWDGKTYQIIKIEEDGSTLLARGIEREKEANELLEVFNKYEDNN